ncbi:MAG: hypothetical protein IJO48_03615, partial [Clostridia bacterium]|nr:hypothetical protein [Clostridia bacterium]
IWDMRKQTRIAFAPALGGALCSNCVSGDIEKVSAVSLEAIRRIIKLKDEDMQKAVLPERVRSELLSIIPEYAEIMLERTLKSAKQLGK